MARWNISLVAVTLGGCLLSEGNAVPTYFFDLHADSLSRWDDIGRYCAQADDAIGHAKDLLLGALVDNDKPACLRHAVAVIRDGTGGHFATVTIGADVKMRIVWATGRHPL